MSFIEKNLVPLLEEKSVSREEMNAYIEEMKTLKEKYFGKVKARVEVCAFFSYMGDGAPAFHFLLKISLVEKPEHSFYINGEKSFDGNGWEIWSVNSPFASDYKHTQHDADVNMNTINWHFFNYINEKFEDDCNIAGEVFEVEVIEILVDYYNVLPKINFTIKQLPEYLFTQEPIGNMAAQEYCDIIKFFQI